MIETKPLEDLISICLWTAYLDDEQPQSLLILSDVEGGKSAMAGQFRGNNGIIFLHDATAFGISKTYGDKLRKSLIKHFIFPEFVFPLSRQKETTNTFLAFLNGLMEEGISEIRTYSTTIAFDPPAKAGVIACLAKDEFTWRKSYWISIGFLSRFLPISYSYSNKVETDIFQAICQQTKAQNKILYNFQDGHVDLPVDLAKQLLPYARRVAKNYSKGTATKKLAGFRAQKSLQRMAKAIALGRGKDTVDQDDIYKLIDLSKYIDLDYNEI